VKSPSVATVVAPVKLAVVPALPVSVAAVSVPISVDRAGRRQRSGGRHRQRAGDVDRGRREGGGIGVDRARHAQREADIDDGHRAAAGHRAGDRKVPPIDQSEAAGGGEGAERGDGIGAW